MKTILAENFDSQSFLTVNIIKEHKGMKVSGMN